MASKTRKFIVWPSGSMQIKTYNEKVSRKGRKESSLPFAGEDGTVGREVHRSIELVALQ